jgi:hypothetical protein
MVARYPDFEHKKTQERLWLDEQQKPPWVEAEMAALPPGTLQLNIFGWVKIKCFGNMSRLGNLRRHCNFSNYCSNKKAWVLTTSLLFMYLMHVLVYERLERAGLYMYRLLKAVVTQMSFSGTALVDMYGAWRRLGPTSTDIPS